MRTRLFLLAAFVSLLLPVYPALADDASKELTDLLSTWKPTLSDAQKKAVEQYSADIAAHPNDASPYIDRGFEYQMAGFLQTPWMTFARHLSLIPRISAHWRIALVSMSR